MVHQACKNTTCVVFNFHLSSMIILLPTQLVVFLQTIPKCFVCAVTFDTRTPTSPAVAHMLRNICLCLYCACCRKSVYIFAQREKLRRRWSEALKRLFCESQLSFVLSLVNWCIHCIVSTKVQYPTETGLCARSVLCVVTLGLCAQPVLAPHTPEAPLYNAATPYSVPWAPVSRACASRVCRFSVDIVVVLPSGVYKPPPPLVSTKLFQVTLSLIGDICNCQGLPQLYQQRRKHQIWRRLCHHYRVASWLFPVNPLPTTHTVTSSSVIFAFKFAQLGSRRSIILAVVVVAHDTKKSLPLLLLLSIVSCFSQLARSWLVLSACSFSSSK